MTMTLPLMSRTVSIHAFQVESWFYKGRMTKKKKKKAEPVHTPSEVKKFINVSPSLTFVFSPPFSLFHALSSSAGCLLL